jgi:DsbC/DsbD-like thiol-disulfide interchange protein
MKSFPKASAVAAAVLFLGAFTADAAVTEWQDIGGGRMRLAAELDPASGKIRGVIDVELKEGWKTYWQEPGDSGIPPQFDFSASRNFTVGSIRYPVPERVELGETAFAGYRGRARFGFDGAVRDPGGEGDIRLQALIGVCEVICIPATAQFEIPMEDLRRSDRETSHLLEEAEKRMPVREAVAGLSIDEARIKDDRTIEATVTATGASAPALFAVGTAIVRIAPGRLVARDGDKARFEFGVYVIGDARLAPGTKLTMTLAQDGRGIERELSVGR